MEKNILKIQGSERIYVFQLKYIMKREDTEKIREDIIRQAREGVVVTDSRVEFLEEIRPTQLTDEDIDKVAEIVVERLRKEMERG